MTRGKWRKAWAVPVLAVVLAGAWAAPLSANQTVSKRECRMGSGDLEEDKAALELAAKRAAAAELYGEALRALTEVRDFSVARETILSQVAGSIRVEGSPVLGHGDNVGEVCVTVRAYATEEDLAQYRPKELKWGDQARECVQVSEKADERARKKARLQLLYRYRPALENHAERQVLKLLHSVNYEGSAYLDEAHQYCARVTGSVYPFEVENLLARLSDPQPGETFRDCPTCPQMVVVPAGSFLMGSPADEEDRNADEGPQHHVTIAQPFAVGVYEVTRGEYGRFVAAVGHAGGNACFLGGTFLGGADIGLNLNWHEPGFKQTDADPVVCVNWADAQAYVAWLSQETGQAYRLLSEAEWEYVARAGTRTRYHFGDRLVASQANYGVDWGATVPVGSFGPNAFGLYDVHGNVWEWVQDCWNENYTGAPNDGSALKTGDCRTRVLRGGSWYDDPGDLRSASRDWHAADYRLHSNGFRIARRLTP